VRCHVRTTVSETEALELPVREFGIICLVACEHLTSVTNILKRYWKRICLTIGHGALWHLYIGALEIFLLTYLLTYYVDSYRVFQKVVTRYWFCDNVRKCTPISTIFTVRTRSVCSIKVKVRLPPHLYSVTTLASGTRITANIDATYFI